MGDNKSLILEWKGNPVEKKGGKLIVELIRSDKKNNQPGPNTEIREVQLDIFSDLCNI